MLRALLPLCDEVVCTSNANPRALSPATLASLTEQLGGPPTRLERRPAPRAGAAPASSPGPSGAVLATGSIYLVADLLRAASAQPPPGRGGPCERRPRRRPSLAMIAGGRGRRRAGDPRLLRARATCFGAAVPVTPSAASSLPSDARGLRDRDRRPQPGRQPADPLPRRDLGSRWLLDVRGRPPADRRPDARRLRGGRGDPVPVRGGDRLHDRAPAGVPRRRARARARDAGRRGADGRAGLPPLPALRLRGQGGLPALPELHAQAQGPVHELQQAARPARGSSARTARRRSRACTPRRGAAGAGAERPPRRPVDVLPPQ